MADKGKARPALRYLGTAYIVGVPARDLSPAEAAEHWNTIREHEKAMQIALYAPVTNDTAEAGEG